MMLSALEKYFGYNKFRPAQEEIIKNILSGKNVLAVLPTGAGKSLCYQLPALLSDNFSIVISPLIALMKNQVDSLKHLNDLAAFINSTMSFGEAEDVLQNIAYGKTKILFVAPERLESLSFAERIKKLNPTFLFIDEAHCISEWGHNFRPSYSKIKNFIDYTGIEKISCFTATATPEVVKDIIEQLKLKSPKVFVKGFERENLNLNVVVTKKKKQKCVELISKFNTPAIIYTSSRKKTVEISEYLNLHRIKCAYYHAGLNNIHRKQIQEDFLNDKVPIIAATNAFGMGIDKKDIRLIIHYNTPGSIENYYQEIGRAGRDGKSSQVYLLHDDLDINIQNYFIENSHPDKILIQNIYNAICDYSKVAVGMKPEKDLPINLEYISGYLKKDISKSILHSSLKILESGNYLKQLSEFDNKISLQFTSDKNKLREFLKNSNNNILKESALLILREYGSSVFNDRVEISLRILSKKSGFTESEINESLTTLDNLGFAEYSKPLSKENIILTQPRVTNNNLILNYKKLNENYLNLQKKLNLMIDYVYTSDCRFKFILNYFGENVKDYNCGKCDKCSGEKRISDSTFEYVKEIILKTINNIEKPVNETTLLRTIKGSSKSNELSPETFGNCANYQKEDLKFILHNLLSQNFIKRSGANFKKVGLGEDGINYLKSKNIIKDEPEEINSYEENLELFNLLRESRKAISKRFMQTGYLICPDEVLHEIVISKPKNESQLLSINGFNQRMFNKLGEDFLEIINNYLSSQKEAGNDNLKSTAIPQNIKETYSLLNKGYNLSEIANLRNLKEAIISLQIETIIEYQPDIDISNLFPQNIFDEIMKEIEKGNTDLKELKKSLPENISYSTIRIAAAKVKFSRGSYSSKFQYTQ